MKYRFYLGNGGNFMQAKCIENQSNNSNFKLNEEYELSNIGIRTEWGGMLTHFEDWNRPKSFNVGTIFHFAMCKFKICQ